jgi:SAM-dependent methyltransferase
MSENAAFNKTSFDPASFPDSFQDAMNHEFGSKSSDQSEGGQGTWAERLGGLQGQGSPTPVANRSTVPFPKRLNLGSGKSWHPEYLNLDINDFWNPDIVADFNHVFPPENHVAQTQRFGELRIEKGSFELISAHDVLEHVANLTTCMKNCLDLLATGGIFDIVVPYDLSYGAWQDPTHVRAFNERSWLYYTDWSWYLGWDEARFEVVKLEFELSGRGKQLQAQGLSMEDIRMSPRAVDSMQVILRKIALSAQDRQLLAQHQQGPAR